MRQHLHLLLAFGQVQEHYNLPHPHLLHSRPRRLARHLAGFVATPRGAIGGLLSLALLWSPLRASPCIFCRQCCGIDQESYRRRRHLRRLQRWKVSCGSLRTPSPFSLPVHFPSFVTLSAHPQPLPPAALSTSWHLERADFLPLAASSPPTSSSRPRKSFITAPLGFLSSFAWPSPLYSPLSSASFSSARTSAEMLCRAAASRTRLSMSSSRGRRSWTSRMERIRRSGTVSREDVAYYSFTATRKVSSRQDFGDCC